MENCVGLMRQVFSPELELTKPQRSGEMHRSETNQILHSVRFGTFKSTNHPSSVCQEESSRS